MIHLSSFALRLLQCDYYTWARCVSDAKMTYCAALLETLHEYLCRNLYIRKWIIYTNTDVPFLPLPSGQ